MVNVPMREKIRVGLFIENKSSLKLTQTEQVIRGQFGEIFVGYLGLLSLVSREGYLVVSLFKIRSCSSDIKVLTITWTRKTQDNATFVGT